MPASEDDPETARLLLRLRALGSPVRLQILKALVTPSRSNEIRVRAAAERAGFEAERFLSRSTVIEHLDLLEEAGLVRRLGDAYAIDQQGMVALLQDLGDLARLRALVEVDVEVTRSTAELAAEPLPPPPRVLIANGPKAGAGFRLAGPGPWRIGRGGECEIALGHDPHVSRVHATLEREGQSFRIRVAAGAKNPVLLDFARVETGGPAPVHPGALLLVGATLLALQV